MDTRAVVLGSVMFVYHRPYIHQGIYEKSDGITEEQDWGVFRFQGSQQGTEQNSVYGVIVIVSVPRNKEAIGGSCFCVYGVSTE